MMKSKFKRPPGFSGQREDPEEQYRAGYQHGAKAILEAIKDGKSPSDLKVWVEVAVQTWRHDEQAEPNPPNI
ncbi:hypothetical protein LZG00_00440 [Rhodobacteraceae bacterium LMO-12]|nr:hypothetical protein [Rhodobacteraceae bacterium LMO-JJ12]